MGIPCRTGAARKPCLRHKPPVADCRLIENKPRRIPGFVVSASPVIIRPIFRGIYLMLNGLWLGFFVVAMVSALAQWLVGGNAGIFAAMVESIFAMAKLSVEVMVLLFGTLTLWLGFLRIAEKAGIVDWLAKALGPLFRRLMPEVPAGHPAIGLITLNFAANGLGLDNAATPIGLKAMKALQELNPIPNTATNAQILFLVLNASSLTLLPVTIFMYRAQQGAADPTLVFLPILLATS
ncbi:hypothetical protein ALP43_04676, partial [Pseudomonas azotoformans]